MKTNHFKAIISSDWNQCLAPCGPFDPIIHTYPDLNSEVTTLFKAYTGNKISLGTAGQKIKELLPEPISIQQMDAYLDDAFTTYNGVPALIDWCAENNLLFMINTTGFMGYFQRIFAKQLLPEVPVLSANPLIRYASSETDPPGLYDLEEIQDKAINTAFALNSFGISEKKIVIIGDSGGDGPHFEWGQNQKAYMIASMAKSSLTDYCNRKKIEIDLFFGPAYTDGVGRNKGDERHMDFMALSSVFERVIE